MTDFLKKAQALFDFTRDMRRDLHQYPELGFKEVRTASIVAKVLSELGLEVQTGIAQTGVVGFLKGAWPGPTILLRFDMDALPIQEETGAAYSSRYAGVMHACGHDGHVAIGLSVARVLASYKDELKGSIKFVFQPGEEGWGGAERMVAQGVLSDVDYCLALHLWNERPVGWFGIVSGPLMAGSDVFTIRVSGRGGHAALPQTTFDPIYVSAQIVTSLQSIISRNISPLQSAVISVTQCAAGEAFNIIPEIAELKGTIRTFEPQVREYICGRIDFLAHQIAAAFGCTAEIQICRLTPPVINHALVTAKTVEAITQAFPSMQIDQGFQTMVSEDMSYMMEKVPGCYYLVGSANPQKGLDYGHHHPKFDFDEEALPLAVASMVAATVQLA